MLLQKSCNLFLPGAMFISLGCFANSLCAQSCPVTVTMVATPHPTQSPFVTMVTGIVNPTSVCDSVFVTLNCDGAEQTGVAAVFTSTWNYSFVLQNCWCISNFTILARCKHDQAQVDPDTTFRDTTGAPATPVDLVLAYDSTGVLTGKGSVTVSWMPNTESDLAGYHIYCGTASGIYSHHQYPPKVTEYIINNLDANWRWYFAVTALDFAGNESNKSKEVDIVVKPNSSGETVNVVDFTWRQPTVFDSTVMWVKGLDVQFPWTKIAAVTHSTDFIYDFPITGNYKLVLSTWYHGRENNAFDHIKFQINARETKFKINIR